MYFDYFCSRGSPRKERAGKQMLVFSCLLHPTWQCCGTMIYGDLKLMIFLRGKINTGLAGAIIAGLFVTLALAYHPLGHIASQKIWYGFLSGVGYPLIGFDYLALFIVCCVIVAFLKNRMMAGTPFIAATKEGTSMLLAVVYRCVVYDTVSVAYALWKATEIIALKPRLSGALTACGGLAYLLEHVEGMIV